MALNLFQTLLFTSFKITSTMSYLYKMQRSNRHDFHCIYSVSCFALLFVGLNIIVHIVYFKYAPVAQLDRVPDFESVGRRFESCRAHHC